MKLDGSAPEEICSGRYAGGFENEHYNSIAVDDDHVYVADSGLSGVLPPQIVRVPAGRGFVYVADTGNTIWCLPAGGP